MCRHDGLDEGCSERCTCPCDNCVLGDWDDDGDTPAEKLLKEIFSAQPELD